MRSQHLHLPTRPTRRIAVVAIVCLAAGIVLGWVLRARLNGASAGATAITQAGVADSPPTTSRAQTVPRLPSLTKLDRPLVQHVVLISIDGLRPDLLLRAKAPSLRALLDRSAFSLWAQTV